MKEKLVFSADPNIYQTLLKRATTSYNIIQGKCAHAFLLKSALGLRASTSSCLIDMYSKCRKIQDARQVFDEMSAKNIVSWNTMISGYLKHDNISEASELFKRMTEKDTVSWNAMISGYSKLGHPCQAMGVYKEMLACGVLPNSFTFASIFGACVEIGSEKLSKGIHAQAIKACVDWTSFMSSGIVAMYAKDGNLEEAFKLFKECGGNYNASESTWNAMIAGYAQNGQGKKALGMFVEMVYSGVKPDGLTFSSIFMACASVGVLVHSQEIHAFVVKNGLQGNVFVGSAMVDSYAKCGSLEDAMMVFEEMPSKNVVSWNAIIGGHSQNGEGNKALEMFRGMMDENLRPNIVAFSCAFMACASLGFLSMAAQIHGLVVKNGYEKDVIVGSSIIDAYSKCGLVEDALVLFEELPYRNVISWNGIIAGYAQIGQGGLALWYFESMLQCGILPDYISFISVLYACSHAGLVDEGLKYFECMIKEYNIVPCGDHFTCMIDLLGRAGKLHDAVKLIEGAPFKPSSSMWSALLGACRIHGDMELGKWAAENLMQT